jgi:hypothetical protein
MALADACSRGNSLFHLSDSLFTFFAAAVFAQQADSIRERELLAGKSGNETAAANLAAALQPAIDAQEQAVFPA